MLVGAAREVINPQVGHLLCGYGPNYPNTGVHDDISVTALYLNDGAREAVLLNFDLIGLMLRTIERIQKAVSQATGIPANQVYLATTHVHTAPDVVERNEADSDPAHSPCRPDYIDRLTDWATRAAAAAKANAEQCQMRYNFTNVDENMNRRYNFPDRRALYIPANKQLAGTSGEYVDRELGIIAFRRKGTINQYKAIITNYTAHPLCVGNSSNQVGADFQGVLRRHVEETFAGCLCLSTTGAAGDNHPLTPEAGFVAAEQMGARLARQAICRTYDAVTVEYDEQLRMDYPSVTLKFKDAETRQMLPEKRAREQESPRKEKEVRTFVSLLGIGPILLAGFPGEPVAELGAMLKWFSPFLKSYVLFCATDLLSYFPTANQFYWGGYEANDSVFDRDAGETLVRSVLDAAGRLIRQQPLRLPALDAAIVNGQAG